MIIFRVLESCQIRALLTAALCYRHLKILLIYGNSKWTSRCLNGPWGNHLLYHRADCGLSTSAKGEGVMCCTYFNIYCTHTWSAALSTSNFSANRNPFSANFLWYQGISDNQKGEDFDPSPLPGLGSLISSHCLHSDQIYSVTLLFCSPIDSGCN